MTAEEVLDQIEAILDGPRGHGDDQAAVWFSKLCAIRDVVDDYREPTSLT